MSALRLAKSKGKRLWRACACVNLEQVATRQAAGASWKVISRELGIGVGKACRALQECSKNLPESCAVNA